MAQGENFKRRNLPTMQLLRFLTELEIVGSSRGSVSMIARLCDVNHSSVSRYFKQCKSWGYLTEQGTFTYHGRKWLEGYKKLLCELPVLARRIGVPMEETQDYVRTMIEHVEFSALEGMVRLMQEKNTVLQKTHGHLWKQILKYGREPLFFLAFQRREETLQRIEYPGFEKKAVLIHNKRGTYLELYLCEMEIFSPAAQMTLQGEWEQIRYFYQGEIQVAGIKNGAVRFPLQACEIQSRQGGTGTAKIVVYARNRVGTLHFPEQELELCFWI